MSLVDKLVVRGSGVALVDAEEVFLGNIWVKKIKTKKLRHMEKSSTLNKVRFMECLEGRLKKQICYHFFLLLKRLPGLS